MAGAQRDQSPVLVKMESKATRGGHILIPAQGCMAGVVSLDDFKLFYLAKSYDVIGLGTFRRHLCKCKEAGDPWAVDMNTGVSRVQQAVRALQARISQIPKPRNALLLQLCKDVMVGAQPPIRMFAGYTTCSLSGVSCNTCIDLTRPAKNSQHVHIHARFSHFFLMLWFCSKLEYVVRSCAKAWLERQVDREDKSFKELCEKFDEETDEYCRQLHGVLTRSYSHVGKTLDLLMHYALEYRVLDANVESLTSTDSSQSVPQEQDTKAPPGGCAII